MNEKLTRTQARVLIYLSVVHKTKKDVTTMSSKLNIGYSYLMQTLPIMVEKGWLVKHQYKRHVFYNITDLAPVEQAVIEYASVAQDIKQKSLNDPYLGVEE